MFNPNLPAVILMSSSPYEPYSHPEERKVDRSILLDVAPDREELLMSDSTIEEIREQLRLRILSSEGHWLYRAQKFREVKLRDATARFSVFDLAGKAANDENIKPTNCQQLFHQTRRRVLSSSSINPSQVTLSIESRLASLDGSGKSFASYDTWDDLALSTQDTLVSPRPLGPTHILVVYSTTPFNSVTNSINQTKKSALRRKPNFNMTFPEVIEMPINDLLFLLNVPNIQSRCTREGIPDISVLPRRLHKELPRVLMRVPHLETFPELIIYLHTLNQAELFRKLIPEWMRDMIHPLLAFQPSVTVSAPPAPALDPIPVFRLLGQLVTGKDTRCNTESQDNATERMILSIAKKIAEFALIILAEHGSAEQMTDPLVSTAAVLDALRDNINCVGYYDKDLWRELDTYQDVLRRAVMWKVKIEIDAINN